MSVDSTVNINLDLSPADIVKIEICTVYLFWFGRSVNQYKFVLRDKRWLTFQHLKEKIVCNPLLLQQTITI